VYYDAKIYIHLEVKRSLGYGNKLIKIYILLVCEMDGNITGTSWSNVGIGM
jgi:hypothetical protein